jgi:hypothetical protein
MKKAAWGQKQHELPSLDEICGHSTSRQVVAYLIANHLIENKSGKICGKITTYDRSSKTKPTCDGTLSIQGPFDQQPNKVYWRCSKCKQKKTVFHGTLLDKFNIPLPQMLQTLYLTMMHIPVSVCVLCAFMI